MGKEGGIEGERKKGRKEVECMIRKGRRREERGEESRVE